MSDGMIDRPSSTALASATLLQERLAGRHLPQPLARLYSQHTRLQAGQPGLRTWDDSEATERRDEAICLIDAAISLQRADHPDWEDGMRRAAEILEWLSHPDTNPGRVPLRLLAAASYQIAGYPARSSGLLRDTERFEDVDMGQSAILAALLAADFPGLVRALTDYWAELIGNADGAADRLPPPADLYEWIVRETTSALGVVCATMRWGDESRLEAALERLDGVADTFARSDDAYSWLLARLCAQVARTCVNDALRRRVAPLSASVGETGRLALERYLRFTYAERRALAWPSQVRGIERLTLDRSFALCTPTGSGKTAVAELAILHALFDSQLPISPAPLALYLVPSRALAAEVEGKLSRVLSRLGEEVVRVTSLYGGVDWGPTDVWLSTEDRAVIICTYEKADALLRFLGPPFLRRVALVVIDEAHMVEVGDGIGPRPMENRSLRLESLGARLLAQMDDRTSRVIALSAVAAGAERSLARWVIGRPDAEPVTTAYRSTRQLIGRLECSSDGNYVVAYDLLDGERIHVERASADAPYIRSPFPPHPAAPTWQGPEKRLRPAIFWAALHLAAPDDRGRPRSVLISVTQNIGGYADDLLALLDGAWRDETLPPFFEQPTSGNIDDANLWVRCLRSCEDYFGTDSREYRLLRRGIVVHHAKMPGLMARLLVRVIERRIARLVIATSTLTEGVNLPFETILIPTLRRARGSLTPREVGNLSGRSGRPGVSTEGRTLVALQDGAKGGARDTYDSLIVSLSRDHAVAVQGPSGSPLAALLAAIEARWHDLAGTNDTFLVWLESIAPQQYHSGAITDEWQLAIDLVDTLDGVLLAGIEEMESSIGPDMQPASVEDRLRRIWSRTYARFASEQEQHLQDIFVRRGQALVTRIYPQATARRRLYRTGMAPRVGGRLLDAYPRIRTLLEAGRGYAAWDSVRRFEFIRSVVGQVSTIPAFQMPAKAGQAPVHWQDILHWWLAPSDVSPLTPGVKQVSEWHDYVTQNFGYRFTWALGGVIALAIDDAYGEMIGDSAQDDWSRTGLPWIVLWLKELVTWGTLDPVAACLLARGGELTRKDAEREARRYYGAQPAGTEADALLDPSSVRKWVDRRVRTSGEADLSGPPNQITVELMRNFGPLAEQSWRVVPVSIGRTLLWFDLAGFPLARSRAPLGWSKDYVNSHDFVLEPSKAIIESARYL